MPKPKPIRERAVRIQAIRVRSAAARLRSLASSLVTFFAVDRSLIADADPCRPGRSYTRGATLAGLDIVAEQPFLSQPQRQQLQGNRTSNLLDTGGVLLGSGVIDSTSRRVGHARGGHDGSVCRVLGGSGGPANRECRAARLL